MIFFLFLIGISFGLEGNVLIYQSDLNAVDPVLQAKIDGKFRAMMTENDRVNFQVLRVDIYKDPYNFPILSSETNETIGKVNLALGPTAPNIISYLASPLQNSKDLLHNIKPLLDEVRFADFIPANTYASSVHKDGQHIFELPLFALPYSLSCLGPFISALGPEVEKRGGQFDMNFIDSLYIIGLAAAEAKLLPIVHLDMSAAIASMMLLRMHGPEYYEKVLSGDVSFTAPELVLWAKEVDKIHRANVFRNTRPSEYFSTALSGKAACSFFPTGVPQQYIPPSVNPFVDVPFPIHKEGMLFAKCGTNCPIDTISVRVVAKFPKSKPFEVVDTFIRSLMRNTYENMDTKFPTLAAWEVGGPAGGLIRSDRIPNNPELIGWKLAADVQQKYNKFYSEATSAANPIIGAKFKATIAPFFTQGPDGQPIPDISFEAKLHDLEVERLTQLFRTTAPVTFSLEPGVYKKQSIKVELATATPGAAISYTTDGTDPAVAGRPYSGPITIHERGDNLVWAIATGKGLLPSEPRTATYVIDKVDLTLILAIAVPAGIVLIAIIAVAIALCLNKRKPAGAEDHLIPSGDLQLREVIGAGASSLVYRAVLRDSIDVAVKVQGSAAELEKAAASTGTLRTSGGARNTMSGGGGGGASSGKINNSRTAKSNTKLTAQSEETQDNAALLPGSVIPSSSAIPASTSSLIPGSKNATSKYEYRSSHPTNTLAADRGAAGNNKVAKHVAKAFTKELVILASLRHPNVILLYGFTPATASHGPGMVLEYMSQGSLFDVLGNTSVSLGSKRKLEMAMDVAKGLSFLANLKPAMVHRDFKSLNILVDGHGTCKVSDFESATTEPEKAAPTLGSIPWTAPEVLGSKGRAHSLASDMYSFGVVLWEIATRREPYSGLTANEIKAAVMEGRRPDSAGANIKPMTGLPEGYASLVARCWSQSPGDRPTVAEVTRELAEMYAVVASEATAEAPTGTRAIAFASKLAPAEEFKAQHLSFLMTGRADSLALPPTTCAVFTDIVGFTRMSETMEPVAVADMLMALFKKFDAICEPLGGVLYKTMGDAYILLVSAESVAAVGGTEPPAVVGTRIALRMAQAAETVEVKGSKLKIRAGVNVGPAALQIMSLDVVEVIGDMMNLAARMEQTSAPGKVQVTEAVQLACRDQISFSTKESIMVKGKGQVTTMFALGEL